MSTVDADDLTWQQPPDPEPLVPATPRELKGLMKDWRSGRATRNVLQAINDAYVALIGAVMIGAMLINVVLKAQSTVAAVHHRVLPLGADHPAVRRVRRGGRRRAGGQPAVRAGARLGRRGLLAAGCADLPGETAAVPARRPRSWPPSSAAERSAH